MTASRVEYHQDAIVDVRAAVDWYRERSIKAASDFVEELQRAAKTISQAPDRWPPGANETRRFSLWRFPFTIIYSERQSAVTVWAVAHASRRPEYWVNRVRK